MKRETLFGLIDEFVREPYDNRFIDQLGLAHNNLEYNTLDISIQRQIGKTTKLIEVFKETWYKDKTIIVCHSNLYATEVMRQLTDIFTVTFLRSRIISKHDFGKKFRGVRKENIPSLILIDESSVKDVIGELEDIISMTKVKTLALRSNY